MKRLGLNTLWVFAIYVAAILVLAACASSKVTEHQPYQGKIARPDRIIIYDFAATASELPPELAIAGQGAATPRATPAQLAAGRRLGVEIAKNLVVELRTMGLPALRAAGQPAPRAGNAVLVGYFTTVEEGSATERVALGFGAGGSELKTVVKGFLMTERGLQPLGSGAVEAGSGQMPGGAAPLVVAVATGNPLGLAVAGAAKTYGEVSGSDTIEGAAQRTAAEIAARIRATAERQGWI